MIRNTAFKDTLLFILGVFFTSVVILSFLYPDLCFFHTRRLLISHETSIPFESTYILVSQFFHGGIQLWDRFDQVNNAYFVSTNGVYGVANLIAAFIFIILSPFFTHPGAALYHTHLFVFYGLTCLIRTVGGYLLLRKLIANKAVIFISLLYLNTILTSFMMTPGLEQQGVYSFFPLVLYFILCFFEDLRLRTFLSACLVMTLSLVSSPYFTAGYFYQGIHFFILSCGVGFVLQRGWRKLRGRPSLPRQELFKNIGLILCCAFIILPYYWWSHALSHDFYIYGSGIGGTQGRFNNIFNLSGYFNIQGKAFANPLEFLGTSLDYHHNVWGSSWVFLGGTSLFLGLIGMVFSKDKRKYIFAASILAVILINTACFPGNFFAVGDLLKGEHLNDWMLYVWMTVSSIAHGINALTNPFSFLVRSFHMVSLLVPMLFLPLIAMGLDSCLHLWNRNTEAIHFKRRWFLLIFFVVVLIWDLFGGTEALGVYYIGQAAAPTLKLYILSLVIIFFALIRMPEFCFSGKRWVGWMILGFAFALDFLALMTYVQLYPKDHPVNTLPVRISPSYTHEAVVPDYQNPRLLPWREFFNAESAFINPPIYDQQCMYGAFYQYTPMGRFFHPWTIYEPRPMAYKDLYPDIEIQQYLIRNPRTLFFANDTFLKTDEKFYNVSLDVKKAKIHHVRSGWEYSFDLPKDFPFYLSTTVFTQDHDSWKLMVNGRLLDPMQGELTTPYTYDAQNIQDKKLIILLPDNKIPLADIILQVKLPDRIRNVWKNTYDDLGLTYQAPKTGWLVFNYPYDEKWEASVDGKKTPISKVNRYFMGIPVTGGEHQILLRYWPHTSLRFWIFISMVLSVICFGGMMYYSIKREPLNA